MANNNAYEEGYDAYWDGVRHRRKGNRHEDRKTSDSQQRRCERTARPAWCRRARGTDGKPVSEPVL